MACICLNLWFFPFFARRLYPITLLQTNSLAEFVKTYEEAEFINMGVAFIDYLKNADLIISPGQLKDIKISTADLHHGLRITRIIILEQPHPLISERDAALLLQNKHIQWPRLDIGHYYLVIPLTECERATYVIKRLNDDWYFIPMTMLP